MLVSPISAQNDEEEHEDFELVPIDHWYKLKTDIITVLFPREGHKPTFIWWYTNAPDQIYVVKFQGVIEWFAFDHPLLPPKPEYYNHLREAWQETWRERFENMYFKPEENRWMGNIEQLMYLQLIMHEIIEEMESKWHRPFLPFDAGLWTLTKPANITTPDGKIIGVSFGFTLVDLPNWMPNMQFAENNIMIRVRFYNETTEETVAGTNPTFKYTVNAGEMKMDLVINKWVWNIDTLKELVQRLQNAGFDISIPEAKSRLALWVNLASINITKLPLAENEPEEIEEHSTATHIEIEDHREDITENRTAEAESPIEIQRPIIKLSFATETATLRGFFRFVSSAKITNYPSKGYVDMVPVKAAQIAGGAHMRVFISYPYFGNGTLEHDPSIGVDVPNIDTTPKYTVQTPTGMSETPVVLGKYALPLFTIELMVALIVVVSATAIILYATKWKRKTPVNMVDAGTTG